MEDQVAFYAYKLTCSRTCEFYYGSRYKNVSMGLTPKEDILIRYFTSSKKVRHLIERFGIDSFSAEILLTGDNREEIFWFEQKLIEDNRHDPLLLNISYMSQKTASRIFLFSGCSHSVKSKQKQSRKKKEHYRLIGRNNQETKNKITSWWTAERKDAARNRMKDFWKNNPEKLKAMKDKKVTAHLLDASVAKAHGAALKEKHLQDPKILESYRSRAIEQHRKNPPSNPFVCIETSQVFTNMAEAGRVLGIPVNGIRKVLGNAINKTTRGYTFKYLADD
jgi:hypothetical protein